MTLSVITKSSISFPAFRSQNESQTVISPGDEAELRSFRLTAAGFSVLCYWSAAENAASRNWLRSEAAVHDVIYGHLDWKWGSETPTASPTSPPPPAHCTYMYMMTHMNTHTHTCVQCDWSEAVERWGGRLRLSAASDFMISARWGGRCRQSRFTTRSHSKWCKSETMAWF